MPNRTQQPPEKVFFGTLKGIAPTPLLIGLTADGALCRAAFLGKRAGQGPLLRRWSKEWPQTTFAKDQRTLARWRSALGASDAPRLLLIGTAFQTRVWRALLSVPRGKTLTYGDLAARIGKPRATRAVGTALGKNPIAFFVPCHRIVAQNGLGGFASGAALKALLLRHELAVHIRPEIGLGGRRLPLPVA